jgi:putative transposase
MVWLCMTSREVIVSSSTEHPNSAWVTEQADLFLDQTAGREKKPDIVMHDLDTKFTKEFTAALKARGLRTNPLPKASPNLNGRCERFIQTIKQECLSKFILFGKRHLDHIIAEFVEYYNTARSHTEREHLPPVRVAIPEEIPDLPRDDITVRSYVGGLVKSFERKAA